MSGSSHSAQLTDPGVASTPTDIGFTLSGGCHCGQLSIVFASAQPPANIVPRACDCSFCQKHGAAYVSDPHGKLSITVHASDALRRYQQGSNSAEFLLCRHCGVLVAVTFASNARIFGAANARCLDGPTGFGTAVSASPQQMDPDEKIARWLQLWIPDVELLTSGK